MDIDEIKRYAPIKGLNLVGTGDFTHAGWLEELKENLKDLYVDLSSGDIPGIKRVAQLTIP